MATATIYIPTIDDLYSTPASRDIVQTTPALGPEWIRHTVERRYPQHRLRVVYGEHGKLPAGPDLVRPGDAFFGVSCTSLTYRNALPLVDYARSIGVPVVIGGAHARNCSRAILRSRPGVWVAVAEGECVVADLLEGKDPRSIPGLLCDVEQRTTQPEIVPYEFEPFLHTSVDFENTFFKYGNNTAIMFRDDRAKRVVPVRGIPGCTKKTPCSFCSVQRVRKYDPPTRARYLADERRSIIEQFGSDVYIRDASDALPEQECLEILAREVKGGSGNRIYCSAMVWDIIQPERLATAREAGYTDILIGLDGFSPSLFSQIGKPSETHELTFKFLDMTRDLPLHLFVTGIVGWAGESRRTLAEARDTIQRLLTYPQVVMISVNYLLALPGTKVHHDMVKLGVIDPLDDCLNMRKAFSEHFRMKSPEIAFEEFKSYVDDKLLKLDPRVQQFIGFEAA